MKSEFTYAVETLGMVEKGGLQDIRHQKDIERKGGGEIECSGRQDFLASTITSRKLWRQSNLEEDMKT